MHCSVPRRAPRHRCASLSPAPLLRAHTRVTPAARRLGNGFTSRRDSLPTMATHPPRPRNRHPPARATQHPRYAAAPLSDSITYRATTGPCSSAAAKNTRPYGAAQSRTRPAFGATWRPSLPGPKKCAADVDPSDCVPAALGRACQRICRRRVVQQAAPHGPVVRLNPPRMSGVPPLPAPLAHRRPVPVRRATPPASSSTPPPQALTLWLPLPPPLLQLLPPPLPLLHLVRPQPRPALTTSRDPPNPQWDADHHVHNFDTRRGPVHIQWFKGGKTNITYNCLDRSACDCGGRCTGDGGGVQGG
jgi:hypothetical protein